MWLPQGLDTVGASARGRGAGLLGWDIALFENRFNLARDG
jgi:hypothetical protein